MKKKISLIILCGIIILSIALRFFQLGTNPPSLDWDEASLGYNAYSVLKTGADEYGTMFPLSIRSFDDHKPPLYVYLDIIPVAVFGLTDFAVRLPSAILGVVAVFLTYLLVKELFNNRGTKQPNSEKYIETIALTSAFFLAISPWHLQFSRAAFEGNIGLTFLLAGMLFFLKGLEHGRFFIFSSCAFVLALYSYHSFRLLIPLLLLSLLILFWKKIMAQKKFVISALVIIVLLGLPIFQNFFFAGSGTGSRLSMVTIFSPSQKELDPSLKQLADDHANGDILGSILHNRRFIYASMATKGYLDHWNPDFLFLHGDGGRQHHAVNMGMLYLWELPFILLGVFLLLKRVNRKVILLFIWVLLAPLASAFTTGTPHPVRAIAMIPPLHIFTAVGVVGCFMFLLQFKNIFLKFGALAIVVGSLMFNIIYYLHQYYVHTPIEYGDFWQYGYKDAFETTKALEGKYKKIIITYHYDQPYIYYLYYNKVNPAWYQKNWDTNKNGTVERMHRVIGNYEFRNIDLPSDSQSANTLIVGTPKEIPENTPNIIKEIKFLNGETAFRVVGL